MEVGVDVICSVHQCNCILRDDQLLVCRDDEDLDRRVVGRDFELCIAALEDVVLCGIDLDAEVLKTTG